MHLWLHEIKYIWIIMGVGVSCGVHRYAGGMAQEKETKGRKRYIDITTRYVTEANHL